MEKFRKSRYILANLGRKLRVGISDQHDGSELWHMFLSPVRLIGVTVAVVVLLFIVILTLAAYTPLLNLIPGHSGGRQREEMIRNILRVDSVERRLGDIEAWGYDVSLIMEGRTPVVHDVVSSDDSARVERTDAVMRNAADSALRAQMEGDGAYGLRRQGAVESGMQAPVRGVVTARFDPQGGVFGVGIATALGQRVLAAGEGTVVSTLWSATDGHTVTVQHPDNLVSIYKHMSQSLVGAGTRVRRGEVLGDVGQGGGEFGFELWHSGNPVNPENYMVF